MSTESDLLLSPTLGLIAGDGDIPRLIIKKCAEQNRPIFVVAIEGNTPPETVANVDHIWLKIGHISSFVDAFNKHNIKDIIFAGGVKRPNFNNLSLDWEAVKLAAIMGYKTLGDDGILTMITRFFESKGFGILTPADILQDLRPKAGTLTLKAPTEEESGDIAKGIKILETLSSADVGQAIIMQMGQVLGIEAIEGTERLIRRVHDYKLAAEGGTLIKMSKSQQNLKIDLPTIGVETIHQLSDSRLGGVAIEAERTQIIDQEAVIKLANELGLFVYVFQHQK